LKILEPRTIYCYNPSKLNGLSPKPNQTWLTKNVIDIIYL